MDPPADSLRRDCAGGRGLAHWIFYAVETHNFVASADHSVAASEAVLTGTSVQVVGSLAIFGGLFFAVGMVMLLINSLRVGLLPRWMAMLGMFAGLLIFLPIGGAQLQAVPALGWSSSACSSSKNGPAAILRRGRPAKRCLAARRTRGPAGRQARPRPTGRSGTAEPAPEPQAVAASQGERDLAQAPQAALRRS